MKLPTNSLDDMLLTLENEREFYDEISVRAELLYGYLKKPLATGVSSVHKARVTAVFRSRVGQWMRRLFTDFRPAIDIEHGIWTTKAAQYFFVRYVYEKVKDTEETLSQLFETYLTHHSLAFAAHFNAAKPASAIVGAHPDLLIVDDLAVNTADHTFDASAYAYVHAAKINIDPSTHTTPEKEVMNNTPTIETRVFILGNSAAEMSDEQIFNHIARIEGEIKKLKEINARPKKLEAKIAKMEEDIAALAKYVDER